MAKQEVLYILSACVALAIQQAQRVHPIILPSVACLAVPYLSTLSHKRHDKMCVLIFSTTVVWNISHSKKNSVRYYRKWPIPVAARPKAWVCGRSLVGIVGSNPDGGMDVCLLLSGCFVLSGRGLCVEMITRPEESYRVWCVWMW